jgi:hypothetical protein
MIDDSVFLVLICFHLCGAIVQVSVVPLSLDPPNSNPEEEVMDSEALVYRGLEALGASCLLHRCRVFPAPATAASIPTAAAGATPSCPLVHLPRHSCSPPSARP